MHQTTATASLWENVVFNACHVVPLALQGTFTRRRSWVEFFSLLQRDPGAVRFYQQLRKRYQADGVYLRLVATKTLVVMNPDSVHQVLVDSPTVFADPKNKREGMSHFQPNALTISRGRKWHDRRRFNDSVLGYGGGLHPYAEDFLSVARQEILASRLANSTLIRWTDFDELFGRIARQVIFGSGARNDRELTDLLRKLMRQANCPLRIRTRHFDQFYRKVRIYLGSTTPADRSLIGMCVATPHTELTRVENQIPHWLFAMWETLATNVARALALVVSHSNQYERVRDEFESADLSTAIGIHSLAYLEACLQEAMRLWPTTPMIIRRTVEDIRLCGDDLPYGSQVMIPNMLHHRDSEGDSRADRFTPEQWLAGPPNAAFNHLSSGPQRCAGRDLALFLGKSVLATILAGGRYELVSPRLVETDELPRSFNYFRVRLRRPEL